MSKFIVLSVLCFSPLFANASNSNDGTCIKKKNALNEQNVIASNIANLHTTRTPEGGPYKIKDWVCRGLHCEVRESLRVIRLYEPSHPDADKNGLVSYPDVRLDQQMKKLNRAMAAYKQAKKDCPE